MLQVPPTRLAPFPTAFENRAKTELSATIPTRQSGIFYPCIKAVKYQVRKATPEAKRRFLRQSGKKMMKLRDENIAYGHSGSRIFEVDFEKGTCQYLGL